MSVDGWHVSAGVSGVHKRSFGPRDLHRVVNHFLWLLGTELRTAIGVVLVFSHLYCPALGVLTGYFLSCRH